MKKVIGIVLVIILGLGSYYFYMKNQMFEQRKIALTSESDKFVIRYDGMESNVTVHFSDMISEMDDIIDKPELEKGITNNQKANLKKQLKNIEVRYVVLDEADKILKDELLGNLEKYTESIKMDLLPNYRISVYFKKTSKLKDSQFFILEPESFSEYSIYIPSYKVPDINDLTLKKAASFVSNFENKEHVLLCTRVDPNSEYKKVDGFSNLTFLLYEMSNDSNYSSYWLQTNILKNSSDILISDFSSNITETYAYLVEVNQSEECNCLNNQAKEIEYVKSIMQANDFTCQIY